jgi:hypothetical protein
LTSRRPNLVWRFRYFSGGCRCKLWPKNENLIFEKDFNGLGNRSELDHGGAALGKEGARRVTFITSAMGTLTEQARRKLCWAAKVQTSTK